MNKKQIIILSIILGFLAFGILLKSWVRFYRDDNNWKRYNTKVYFFSPSGVESILIGRGGKTPFVELAKESGGWRVKGLWNAKADPTKIHNFLEKLLKAMKKQEFRGKGKNLFPDFGITDQDAFSIKLTEPHNPTVDLRLGTKKAGEGYFIRWANDDSVFFIEEDMADLLGIYTAFEEAVPRSDFWADLSIFNLDPEKVTRVTAFRFKGDEKIPVLELVRETDPKDPLKISWKFPHKDISFSPDPDKVLKFIVTMQSIRAQKVMDPAGKEYGLEKPVLQLAVTQDGKETLFNAGPKDAKGDLYYVKLSDNPTIFGLSAHYFDDLNVDDAHLIKDTPPAPGPGKTSSSTPENQAS